MQVHYLTGRHQNEPVYWLHDCFEDEFKLYKYVFMCSAESVTVLPKRSNICNTAVYILHVYELHV